ncbi:MAG: FlgD immunoglobulin-like domain containing protein [Candidatus Zixiibacteriota bacterium]
MKRFSMIAGIITLVLFVSVLVGVSDVVSAQGQRGDHHGKGFWANLTEEQREAVRVKTKEMRSQDATREEIRTAVAELLQGYGIELPEKCRLLGGSEGLRHNRGGFMANLTDEQRGALREKVKDMRSQGATREEIRAAKAEMLKGYGVELPDNRGERRGFGHGRGGFGADLTDEQRQTLREKVREMRSQDASREEIRTAIDEMLQEYGFDLPEKSESTSSEKTTAELNIQAQSYPNPFNPETQIAYTLSVSENVRIQIYNVAGQLIRSYDLGYQPAGTYSVSWDGRNESGDITASGVYLYRIEAGPYEATNSMVLLK